MNTIAQEAQDYANSLRDNEEFGIGSKQWVGAYEGYIAAATKYQHKTSEPVGYLINDIYYHATKDLEPDLKNIGILTIPLYDAPQPKPASDDLVESINMAIRRADYNGKFGINDYGNAAQACSAIAQSHIEAAVKGEAVGFAELCIKRWMEFDDDTEDGAQYACYNSDGYEIHNLSDWYELYQASKK